MAKLKNLPRPAGQSEEYLFVHNETTGRSFKAKHELRTSPGGRPAIAVSISPVDAEGHALLNDAGAPDVKWHFHEFTEAELEDPAFDVEARVVTILAGSIDAKENDLAARDAIKKLSAKWTGSTALQLGGAAERVTPAIAAPPGKK